VAGSELYPQAEVDALVSHLGRYVTAMKGILADATEDNGYYVIRAATLDQLREVLADAGALGQPVTFRVICPLCGWQHSWQQYEHEPGRFDGFCRQCGARCNGDSPAVVRHDG
jgi:hypothetical protein